MGLFEHWPYVNFHDLNLDWIIKEIPKVFASRDEAQASAEASAESAAASQLSADASQASAEASQLSAEASQASADASQDSAEASAASEANAKNYADHIADPVSGLVTDWLDDHVTPTTPIVDNTLRISGAAADAKATGDAIATADNTISFVNTKLSSRLEKFDKIVGLNPLDFEISTVTYTSYPWVYNWSNKRASLKDGKAIFLHAGSKIYITDNTLRFYGGYYTEGGVYYSTFSWTESASPFTCPVDGYYGFTIAKITDEEVITDVTPYVSAMLVVEKGYDGVFAERLSNLFIDNDFFDLFELGDINAATTPPTYGNRTSRIRTLQGELIDLKQGDIVSLTDFTNLVYYIGCQKYDGTWWNYPYWLSSEYAVPFDGKYYLLIRNSTETTITDIKAITDKLTIKKAYNIQGDIYEKINTNQKTEWLVKSINHRGYERLYPENTLPAFKASAELGWGYVETDVRFTSDGVAVLLHDESINRTARNSDGTAIATTINISDITYNEALTYDFGIYKGDEFAGTKIPTLAQFLTLCRNLSLKPYLEIKTDNVTDIVTVVRQHGMMKNTTFISFARTHLEQVRDLDGNARLGMIVSTVDAGNLAEMVSLKTGTNEVFADVLTSGATDAAATLLISADIGMEVYTPNTLSDIISLNPYVTGVTSDWRVAGRDLYEASINNI